MTAPVVPTQRIREESASAYFAWISGNPVIPEKMRAGKIDDHSMIQRFARIRLAALEEAARVADEAAAAAENVSAMGAGDGYERLLIRAAAARRLSAAIRSLKEPNNG